MAVSAWEAWEKIGRANLGFGGIMFQVFSMVPREEDGEIMINREKIVNLDVKAGRVIICTFPKILFSSSVFR